jgi:hypothetical protein
MPDRDRPFHRAALFGPVGRANYGLKGDGSRLMTWIGIT